MSPKQKSTLRTISVLIVLIIIAMYFGFLPFIDVIDEFWVMVIAYALMVINLK